jgi:hypothetical protein
VGEVVGERWEQIDFASGEGGHGGGVVGVLFCGELGVFAEDSNGDGAAEIGVECCAIAVIVGGGVFGLLGVDAAVENSVCADMSKGLGCVGRGVCKGAAE